MGGMFHEKRSIKRAKLFNAGCIRRFQNKNKILSGWSKFAGTRCYVTRNPFVENEIIRRLSALHTSWIAKLIGERCVQRGKGHVHFRVATELLTAANAVKSVVWREINLHWTMKAGNIEDTDYVCLLFQAPDKAEFGLRGYSKLCFIDEINLKRIMIDRRDTRRWEP